MTRVTCDICDAGETDPFQLPMLLVEGLRRPPRGHRHTSTDLCEQCAACVAKAVFEAMTARRIEVQK